MAYECQKCGAMAVMFADYERNDLTALGLKCNDFGHGCDWQETMADLYRQLKLAKAQIERYRHDLDAVGACGNSHLCGACDRMIQIGLDMTPEQCLEDQR